MDETKCIKRLPLLSATLSQSLFLFCVQINSDHSDTKTKQLQLTKSPFSSPSESFIGNRCSQSLSPSLPLSNG